MKDNYDDIRPYNDEEIPAALERIVNDPFFVPAMNFAFPDADMERVAEVMRTCKTADDMQERIMFSVIRRIIDSTIDNFTYVLLTARATRRDVAPLAMVLTRERRSSGMNSNAISGMMVIHVVQSTIRIKVSSDPDSK